MDRKIIIYGMPNFTEPDELMTYIRSGVFAADGGRFDYSQRLNADVIVLSLNGIAYGHFDVAGKEKPSEEMLRMSPTTRAVYIVKKPATLYKTPVAILPLGISRIRFGKSLSEEQFQQIQRLAGNTIATDVEIGPKGRYRGCKLPGPGEARRIGRDRGVPHVRD